MCRQEGNGGYGECRMYALGPTIDRRHLVNVMLPNDSNDHYSSRFVSEPFQRPETAQNASALRLFFPRNHTLHSARRWGSIDPIKSKIARATPGHSHSIVAGGLPEMS